MQTTSCLKILSRILFFVCVFFIVVFFADWFSGPFFLNMKYRALKYVLSVFVPAGLTVLNYRFEKTLSFIANSMIIIMSFFVIGFLVLNTLGVHAFEFRETSSLYHITYALIGSFSVFFTATAVAHIEKSEEAGYEFFYNAFFVGYTPMMISLYVLLYFNYREPDMAYSVNLIPFRGEFRNLIVYFAPLTVMRTVGNIAYYSTISLCAAKFAKKHQTLFAFLVPFSVSVLTEAVQGLFRIGDADIDDIILNSLGALIGALVYKYFVEKIRRNNLCSE